MASPEPQEQPRRELVSGTSILILSGFLIGMTVGRTVNEELSPFVLAAGLAGLVSFIGLEVSRARARERQALAEQETVTSRLQRHVPGRCDATSKHQASPSH